MRLLQANATVHLGDGVTGSAGMQQVYNRLMIYTWPWFKGEKTRGF